MTLKNKEKLNGPLVIIILLVIIIVVIGLLVLLLQFRNPQTIEEISQEDNVTSMLIDETVTNPTTMLEEYRAKLMSFSDEISGSDYPGDQVALAKAQDLLLSMRVPQPYLDIHFQTVVALNELEKTVDDTATNVQKELESIFQILIDALP